MPLDWNESEVKLIVTDYFSMLSSELKGDSYSKADHRRALLPLLQNRSEGSIEFKHQNISAVLINLGQPYIKGYLPRFNYQKSLEDSVINQLTAIPSIEQSFIEFVEKKPNISNANVNFEDFVYNKPVIAASEPDIFYNKRNPIKVNYLEREQRNRNLGLLGEELVIKYEKWILINQGKEKYADQIKWVSKEEGDGFGFDILSKNINGKDKYIEVKTTKLSKETPFYFSRNELLFSQSHSQQYNLYRLFNFEDKARMFIRNGRLDSTCHVTPISFRGSVIS
jgi:hypothetical protein